eukprot:scaffold13.g364.t1
MASDEPAVAAPAPVCVTAATAGELATARAALDAGSPLVAHKALTAGGQQVQTCALQFHEAAGADAATCGAFQPRAYFAALRSSVLGRVLMTAESIGSTQEVVQENAARLPDGLLFVADRQAGGKGRGGNRWESPAGCLMFSAFKQLDIPGHRLPFVQYVVSLAVVQAAQAEAARLLGSVGGSSGEGAGRSGSSSGGSIDVRVKWPNDIYAGGLKIGGILCHTSCRGQAFHLTLGVGINVSNREPTTCLDALVEAAAAAAGRPAPPPPSREALLAGIAGRLEGMLHRLGWEGFAPFERDYYAAWLHGGQQVQLEDEGRRVHVRIEGLSSHGYLLAADAATGERYELHPDGNSLDFFHGLVKKKLQ